MCGRFVITNPVAKTKGIVKTAIKVEDNENYNAQRHLLSIIYSCFFYLKKVQTIYLKQDKSLSRYQPFLLIFIADNPAVKPGPRALIKYTPL